ncbi:MAG: hypothetical protein ACJ78Q_00715 [Chloroflexia bacterium]
MGSIRSAGKIAAAVIVAHGAVAMLMLSGALGLAGSASAGQLGKAPAGSGQPASPLAPVGSGFTYQGRLNVSGSPAGGQYDLVFTLYDALSAGAQVGSPVTVANKTVSNGLFTVSLDFGAGAFQGQGRWLEMQVRPAGQGAYTTLAPRQQITAAPYAMGLMPGASITSPLSGPSLIVSNSNGHGVYGTTSSSNTADAGLYGLSLTNNGNGVIGVADTGSQAWAMYGHSTNGFGVRGVSSTGFGVYGETAGNSSVAAVYGKGTGLASVGVSGLASNNPGTGVLGKSNGGPASYGVQGICEYGVGVDGWSAQGTGVQGDTTGGTAVVGIVASGGTGRAGVFLGDVLITGSCCQSAQGTFQIDHPLDPSGKYLNESAVASPDMLDIYRGHVTLDGSGAAWVQLPDYFEALNRDFDYQLTAIGAPAPNLYVAQEIEGNRFQVAGGKPGMKVSWQVTGVRHDLYAEQHPMTPEQAKPAGEQGKYLHPELYGQPESKEILPTGLSRHADTPEMRATSGK